MTEMVFLNDPTWRAQHIEADPDHTLCGLEVGASGFAPLPSKRVASTKPLCIICFEALAENERLTESPVATECAHLARDADGMPVCCCDYAPHQTTLYRAEIKKLREMMLQALRLEPLDRQGWADTARDDLRAAIAQL